MNSSAVTPAPLEVLEDDPLPSTIRTAQHKLLLLPDMDVMLTAIQRERLAKARTSAETVVIRGTDEVRDPASRLRVGPGVVSDANARRGHPLDLVLVDLQAMRRDEPRQQ